MGDPLSSAQEAALAVLPIPSAALSVAGSSCILYTILLSKRRRSTGGAILGTRRIILVALSVFDMFLLLSLAVHPFLLPRGTYSFAIGNNQTCRPMGTLYQMGLGSNIYYIILSFYHLLRIRFGISDRWMAEHLEVYMHTLVIGFLLGTSLTGAAMDFYAPSVNPLAGFWNALIFYRPWYLELRTPRPKSNSTDYTNSNDNTPVCMISRCQAM